VCEIFGMIDYVEEYVQLRVYIQDIPGYLRFEHDKTASSGTNIFTTIRLGTRHVGA
jgi:hypothetical protein